MDNHEKKGFLLAGAAFVFWGLTPFYFKALSMVPPMAMVSHRVIWSAGMLALLLVITDRQFFHHVFTEMKAHGWALGVGALLLSANWLTYIYAVVTGQILEASLGYFINPLVNVALAAIFLRERLSRIQKIAVFLAGIGVTQEIFRFGQFPTLAVIMAVTFGVYGLIRKKAAIAGSEGLFIETVLLFPFAIGYLFYLSADGQFFFLSQDMVTICLLTASGLVTTLPLIWFISASKKLPYSIIGMMQYIAPTLMGILGYWVYREGFPSGRLLTFILVWSGLIMVVVEGFHKTKNRKY